MKEEVFFTLVVVHVLIWMFILLAFLDKHTAYINVHYLIPLVYVLHILPFHLLSSAKASMYKDDWEKREKDIFDKLIIPRWYNNVSKSIQKFCTFNPISPQGMLILGMITSVYVLYPPNYGQDFQTVKSWIG